MSAVRKAIAILLSLAVQCAALGVPFVHAHPDGQATGHHHGRTVHTHWAGHTHFPHPSDTPAVGTADHDRAVFLNSFVAISASLLSKPDVVYDVFEVPAPMNGATPRGVVVVRSHDPPFFRSLSSRAPPAFLS